MLLQIRTVLEERVAFLTCEGGLLVHFHVQGEEFFLLKDLIAVEAVMDFTFVVNKTVNAKFLAHFKASGADIAWKFLGVDDLVFVNETSVRIAGCCV